jgi:hypothetical protein
MTAWSPFEHSTRYIPSRVEGREYSANHFINQLLLLEATNMGDPSVTEYVDVHLDWLTQELAPDPVIVWQDFGGVLQPTSESYWDLDLLDSNVPLH